MSKLLKYKDFILLREWEGTGTSFDSSKSMYGTPGEGSSRSYSAYGSPAFRVSLRGFADVRQELQQKNNPSLVDISHDLRKGEKIKVKEQKTNKWYEGKFMSGQREGVIWKEVMILDKDMEEHILKPILIEKIK